LAAGGGVTYAAYAKAIARARAKITGMNSLVVPTRFGDLEYAEAGSGLPFLMIHGTGGGFDQGLQFAARLAAAGYRVIAPSRFGYLRSAMPADPSSENQADALADLLDRLGIARIAVAGGSAGALSALQFAIRHPDRCAALFPIVPAAFAPNRPPARPWSPWQTFISQSVLNSDFLFWAALVTAPDSLIQTLLATDVGLVKTASPAEQARLRDILWGILPVSDRAAGLLNDAKLAGNPAPMALAAIHAPTLAISLEDDRFLTADAARHIAASVRGARLIVYPTGGHVWIGHDGELFDAIGQFLRDIGYE
jgi:pimeloyl-ACP methyl ester carboxylesterase